MQTVFETFLERISESIDEVDFRDALADAAKHLGLPTFAYLVVPAKSAEKPRLISNYPLGWTSYYLRHRYDEIDPVIQRARCGGCPFQWRQGCCGGNATQAQQRMLNEAAEFGIASGLTIPIHDLRGGFAALTFAADEPNPAFLRAAEKYELALQLMATCFHVEVRRTTVDDHKIVDGPSTSLQPGILRFLLLYVKVSTHCAKCHSAESDLSVMHAMPRYTSNVGR